MGMCSFSALVRENSLTSFFQLFQTGCAEEQGSAKWLAIFIKGAHNLFWLDVENSTRRFSHIWRVRDRPREFDLV